MQLDIIHKGGNTFTRIKLSVNEWNQKYSCAISAEKKYMAITFLFKQEGEVSSIYILSV